MESANGVGRSTSSPFGSCDTYKRLHSIATEKRPDTCLENEHFATAVLRHDKDSTTCTGDDFLWFKVKSKHSVARLKAAYLKRTDVPVHFRHANNPVSDSTQMRNLNPMKDNIVVFTAHEEAMDQATPSSDTGSASVRNPLQLVNTQLSAIPCPHLNRREKNRVKSENAYTFPSENMQHIPPAPSIGPPQSSSNPKLDQTPRSNCVRVKDELETSSSPGPSVGPQNNEASSGSPLLDPVKAEAVAELSAEVPAPNGANSDRLRKLMDEGSPEMLEAEVWDMQILLEAMLKPMISLASKQRDAQHWVQQIETLQKHQVDTPTIIGVVGNTGAGKSSVINAILEEERLVPTNCMRACTAVVTEMSWNSSEDSNAKYRAEIEFIQAADWEKDLRVSLAELLDSSGQVSRDCNNADSEAGIAYAKIKSVYPQKTKEMLAACTAEGLMNELAIKRVLGTTMKFQKSKSDLFYRALQSVIDSKEKKKGERKEMEFWPLIKVVKIYTKAEALSTGAVIVDLPGVHDSNAARAAVAAGYMKQCTGLFIVAPINRAVDDKAAKSLLGESFKRQLKFDGTYSRITFICSKTDDISVMEASDSLGLEEKMAPDWDRIDEIEKKLRALKESLKDLKESRGVFTELTNDADDRIEEWEILKDQVEDGKEVWAPDASKKRKRSAEPKNPRKKAKNSKSSASDDDMDDFLLDEGELEEDENVSDVDSDSENDRGDPLTLVAIEEKIAQFREDKRRARAKRSDMDSKVKGVAQEVKTLEKSRAEIEAAMSAVCIEGRNTYSRSAIQRDFADGIRELDMENAQEDDPDNFNPEDEIRDYEEAARTLPVFCVSSRAFQKLSGRLQRDAKVSGFRSPDETEIPQLQAHCKKLTDGGRSANCRAFLTNFSQLLMSLSLWASNDGSGVNLSDAQLAVETRFLKNRLNTLEKSLEKSVKDCLNDMNHALAENIFENYDHVVEAAVNEANVTVSKWHRPVNRDNRQLGGYYWGTYKAIMRREGVFTNAQGPHDFNAALAEPVIKHLASHWERVFTQRLPRVFQSFARNSKILLTAFHREVEARSMKLGTGVAVLGLLGKQLRNYEAIFTTLTQQMAEVINGLQREANREFTPVIARNLTRAYDHCAAESGGGMFVRMKSYMCNHIDQNRMDMFRESVDEVKRKLDQMCEQVEETMAARADEVFMMMSRDYLSVMCGSELPEGQAMPRWERKMRAEVVHAIDDMNTVIAEAKNAAVEAKLAEEQRIAEEKRVAKEKKLAEDKKAGEKRKAGEEKKTTEGKAADGKTAEGSNAGQENVGADAENSGSKEPTPAVENIEAAGSTTVDVPRGADTNSKDDEMDLA